MASIFWQKCQQREGMIQVIPMQLSPYMNDERKKETLPRREESVDRRLVALLEMMVAHGGCWRRKKLLLCLKLVRC